MLKAIGRLFKAMDNTVAIVENITEAGAIASQSTVTLATNFNVEQEAKLTASRAKLDASIKNGDYDL